MKLGSRASSGAALNEIQECTLPSAVIGNARIELVSLYLPKTRSECECDTTKLHRSS
jgi:hypothetical protein